MSKDRTQRYRLTHEFILRDRGDYALVRELFREALQDVETQMNGRLQGDYLAIDKNTEPTS